VSDERRAKPRFVTELPVKLRRSEWEDPLDDRAVARDVTVDGFKVETQTILLNNQVIHFELELFEGSRVAGFGRVAWVKQEQTALFAGVTIEKLPAIERRRLRRFLHPNQVDWVRIGDAGLTTAFVILTATALHRLVFFRQDLHPWIIEKGPMIAAGVVASWALVVVLRRF